MGRAGLLCSHVQSGQDVPAGAEGGHQDEEQDGDADAVPVPDVFPLFLLLRQLFLFLFWLSCRSKEREREILATAHFKAERLPFSASVASGRHGGTKREGGRIMGVVWEAQVVVCWYPTEEGEKTTCGPRTEDASWCRSSLSYITPSFLSLSFPPSHLPGFLILTPSFSFPSFLFRLATELR